MTGVQTCALPISESLRQTLFEHLQMESYLTAALGRINLTPESILKRESDRRHSPQSRWIWGATAVTLLLLAGALVVRMGRPARSAADATRRTDASITKKVTEHEATESDATASSKSPSKASDSSAKSDAAVTSQPNPTQSDADAAKIGRAHV